MKEYGDYFGMDNQDNPIPTKATPMNIDVLDLIDTLEGQELTAAEVLERVKQELGPSFEVENDGNAFAAHFSVGQMTDVQALWFIAGTTAEPDRYCNTKRLPPNTKATEFLVARTSDQLFYSGQPEHGIFCRFSYQVDGKWFNQERIVHPQKPVDVVLTPKTTSVHLFNIGLPKSDVSGLKKSKAIKCKSGKKVVIADYDLRGPLPDGVPAIDARGVDQLIIENCLGQGTPEVKRKGFENSGKASWYHFFAHVSKSTEVIIRHCEGFDFHHAVWLDGCRGWDIHNNTWHDSTYSDVAINKSRGIPGYANSVHHNVLFGRFSHRQSGDRVSYLQCIGEAESPLNIDDNFCEMVPDIDDYNIGANGGFVMLGDHGDVKRGVRQQFLSAQRNIGINTGHYLFNITGGYCNTLKNNMGVIDRPNRRNNRGVGLTVVNQHIYKPEIVNTDFGHGLVRGNRVNAIGRDKRGNVGPHHMYVSRDPLNRHKTFKIDDNELGLVSVDECRLAAVPIIQGAMRFDIPDTYTSEL